MKRATVYFLVFWFVGLLGLCVLVYTSWPSKAAETCATVPYAHGERPQCVTVSHATRG